MKLLYKIAMAVLPVIALSSCSKDEPFSVVSSSDEPHILDPIFPDRINGELPVVSNINRDANFKMSLTVTPSQSTDVVWFIDGEQVASGTAIDMPLPAGSYNMKVTATTIEGKSTYREGIINVNPLDGDPWAFQVGFERIVSPGESAMLYGDNLSKVESMLIGDAHVNSIVFNKEDGTISYTVPENITDGTVRLVLIDAEGTEYGGNLITVSSKPLITSGADRMTSNSESEFTGINLDKITSININGNVMEIIEKNSTLLTVKCPVLDDGEYILTGTSVDGAVQFYINGAVVDETSVIVSSEQTLWAGHHYVSWDLDDSSPNKTFNLISSEVFASIKPGSILSIHYSVEPTAEYHQIRTTSGWWADLPGTAVVEFAVDGVLEVSLTSEVLAMIAEQAGFLCVGHGYYVDLVTLR